MPYNLHSPNGLLHPIDLSSVARWFAQETYLLESRAMVDVLARVAANLDDFVRWPDRAMLLWNGCDRVPAEGQERKYHCYPEAIRRLAKKKRVYLDSRPNGPAIAAFMLAGGVRPERFGSSNAWSIHHVYSGKFPYVDRDITTHAIKDCRHFTQSAGLIATHPVADAVADEFPSFAWLLRVESFRRFGYDPDGVFSAKRDRWGFAEGYACEVFSA